jgi:hypothetical protein
MQGTNDEIRVFNTNTNGTNGNSSFTSLLFNGDNNPRNRQQIIRFGVIICLILMLLDSSNRQFTDGRTIKTNNNINAITNLTQTQINNEEIIILKMTERVKFFGLSDEKLYYDERKKRFVYLEDAPAIAEKAYKNSHFKEQRPDLYGQEQHEFKMKLKYGQQLLRQMNY